MRNTEYVMQHGKLVLPEESLDKIKSLSVEWVEKTEITIILATEDNSDDVSVDTFIDRIVVFLKDDDEDGCLDVSDILLHHLLFEYGGICIEGHIFDSKGVKWLVEIMYLLSGGFGAYKMYPELDNMDLDPSLN